MKKINELTELFLEEKHPRIMKFKEGLAVIWKRNKTATEGYSLRRFCSENGLFRGDPKQLKKDYFEERSKDTLITNTGTTLRRTVKVEHSPVLTRNEIVPVKSCLRQGQQGTPEGSPSQNCKRVTFSIYALILSAASQNAVSDLKELLDKKPFYINKPSSSGETALHKAAAKGNAECIKLLVQRGANVNLADKQGRTPLFLSWEKQHFECHKLMLTSLKRSSQDSVERSL